MILKLKKEKQAQVQEFNGPIIYETIEESFFEGDVVEVKSRNTEEVDLTNKQKKIKRFGYEISVSNKSETPQKIFIESPDPKEYRMTGFLINDRGVTFAKPVNTNESMSHSI